MKILVTAMNIISLEEISLFIQKFGWTIPKPSNKRYFYFQLNLSAMLKYVIKTVVKTRKTHISFLKIWCVILQKKMRDSYSLVRRCKHTQKIHALNIRVLYHYVQWETYSHRFVLIGPSHVKNTATTKN